MYFNFFSADHCPATFSFGTAHCRHRGWKTAPHAVAMGHLVKAVLSCDGANLDRFKQDIVSWVSAHSLSASFILQAANPKFEKIINNFLTITSRFSKNNNNQGYSGRTLNKEFGLQENEIMQNETLDSKVSLKSTHAIRPNY
jgi:hypothetical protein